MESKISQRIRARKLENIFLANQTSIHRQEKNFAFSHPSFYLKKDIIPTKNQYKEGHFQPLIDRVMSFDQIIEAYTYVETGQK